MYKCVYKLAGTVKNGRAVKHLKRCVCEILLHTNKRVLDFCVCVCVSDFCKNNVHYSVTVQISKVVK
jgi:hypothetical protein